MEARNPELEHAIVANPNDSSAYLVYADWLQTHGDPRGELVALQHAGKQDEANELIAKHRERFLGRFADARPETFEIFEIEWQLGFIKSAEIGWEMFEVEDDEDSNGMQLAEFLKLPSARFVQKLVLGPCEGEDEMSLRDLAAAIDEVKPLALRELYLGDIGDWDISGTSTRMPHSESIQEIRKLTIRGGSVDLDEQIDLPELVEFTVQSGSLVTAELRAIGNARWPKLERLEIWFGDPNYGASGGVDDIRPILEGRGLANLRKLGLRNCPFADELARALITARVVPQLTELDLSMGNLSDRGVEAMLASKDAFAHLANLVIEDNALTDASWPAARALAKTVVFGARHNPDRAVPRGDTNRYRRFVSVGE